MVCKTICTSARTEGFTLVEIMIAFSLGLLGLAAVMSFFLFSNRSFISLGNYLNLDQQTQLALDKTTREIRQVQQLTGYTSNSLTFLDWDGGTLVYTWNPTNQVLTRSKGGVVTTNLTGCDYLSFSIYQRTPSNDSFLPYPTTTATNTKLVELTWHCSRTILGATNNTESMQSAKVVIRK